MNIRQEIVAAIADRLQGLTLEGETVPVYQDRYMSIKELPGVIVYATGDTSEKTPDEQANRRNESVKIVVYTDGLEEHEQPEYDFLTVTEKLNMIIGQIETELNKQYETLNRLVYRMNYRSTTISIRVDGGKVIGVGTMFYDCLNNEQI